MEISEEREHELNKEDNFGDISSKSSSSDSETLSSSGYENWDESDLDSEKSDYSDDPDW